MLSAAEVGELGLAKLTGLDTAPVGALEQSIFYVNQVMQFGKLLAVFQAHPSDPGKTVVSVFTALAIESNLLGKQKQFANVPVLRNLVPAQVLLGRSSFNSGKSLSAGLPVYARNQIRAIAAILEAGGQAAGKPTRQSGALSRAAAGCRNAESPRFSGPFCLDFATLRRYIRRTFRQAVSFACSERHHPIPG